MLFGLIPKGSLFIHGIINQSSYGITHDIARQISPSKDTRQQIQQSKIHSESDSRSKGVFRELCDQLFPVYEIHRVFVTFIDFFQ
jgi:hypothetical protein